MISEKEKNTALNHLTKIIKIYNKQLGNGEKQLPSIEVENPNNLNVIESTLFKDLLERYSTSDNHNEELKKLIDSLDKIKRYHLQKKITSY